MNIVITGSGGFIGSALHNALQNNHRVIGVDFENADICADLRLKFTPELQNEFKIADCVIHCAAIVGVSNFLENSNAMVDNWRSDYLIFEQCAKNKTPLIYFSTSEIYGSNGAISENSDYQLSNLNRSSYAIGKLFSEKFIQSSLQNYIILRPFNIAGPNQNPLKGVIPGFITKAVRNLDIEVYSVDGKIPSRAFFHISDLCNAVNELVSRFQEFNKSIYNIGSEKSHSILNIANTIIKYLKSNSSVIIVEPRDGDNVILERNPGVCKIFGDLGLPKPKGIEFILKDCMKFHI